LLKCCGDCKCC